MSTTGIGVIESAHSLTKPISDVAEDNGEYNEENNVDEILEPEIQLPIITSFNQNDADPLSSDLFNLPTVLHNDNNVSLLDSAKPMLDGLLTSATAEPTNSASESGTSDSEIEMFEMLPETIEVSDDESDECSELLKNAAVPKELIETLKHQFKSMINRIRDSTNRVSNVMIEVPNQTWSLPWVVVSNVYKGTSKRMQSTNRTRMRQINKRGRKKKSISNKLKDKYFHNQLSKIKSEKNGNEDRTVSILHTDTNRCPEFFEFTRFGRLRKKPNRLTDSLTPKLLEKNKPVRKNLTRTKRINKATSGQVVKQSGTSDEISKLSKVVTPESSLSDLDVEDDSGDSRARWIAGFSLDSDIDMSSSNGTSTSSNNNESNNSIDHSQHNIQEKLRRLEMAKCFKKLNEQISFENDESDSKPVSKIQILINSIDVIHKLEYDLGILNGTKTNLLKYQALLEYRLQQNKRKLNDSKP